jgi:hypothetical protein
MNNTCNCYVKRLPAIDWSYIQQTLFTDSSTFIGDRLRMQLGISRWGAHSLSCPHYRPHRRAPLTHRDYPDCDNINAYWDWGHSGWDELRDEQRAIDTYFEEFRNKLEGEE